MDYAIIGQGKLARHLAHWFELEEKNFSTFNRNSDFSKLQSADVILLAISDSAIKTFYSSHASLHSKKWIHFSGTLYIEDMLGLHPMMSFSSELFDKNFYNSIKWVLSHDVDVSMDFPVDKNNTLYMNKSNREFYHALCVVAGNIPHLIWSKVETDFLKLGLEQKDIYKYIKVSAENYFQSREVTGPIVRKDETTITKNLRALPEKLREIYKSVIGIYNE